MFLAWEVSTGPLFECLSALEDTLGMLLDDIYREFDSQARLISKYFYGFT